MMHTPTILFVFVHVAVTSNECLANCMIIGQADLGNINGKAG